MGKFQFVFSLMCQTNRRCLTPNAEAGDSEGGWGWGGLPSEPPSLWCESRLLRGVASVCGGARLGYCRWGSADGVLIILRAHGEQTGGVALRLVSPRCRHDAQTKQTCLILGRKLQGRGG